MPLAFRCAFSARMMNAGVAVATVAVWAEAIGADPAPVVNVRVRTKEPIIVRRPHRAHCRTVPRVSFEVIPAIDVSGGRLARLEAGRLVPVDAFDGDPIAAAEVFIGQGARKLQVVDLDLAFTGRPENLRTISLLAVMDARIQASGGVASEEHAAAFASAGAERVVLGSAALAERPLVER